MSLFKDRKASKKRKSKAAPEEWDEIEENEEEEKVETEREDEEILAPTSLTAERKTSVFLSAD